MSRPQLPNMQTEPVALTGWAAIAATCAAELLLGWLLDVDLRDTAAFLVVTVIGPALGVRAGRRRVWPEQSVQAERAAAVGLALAQHQHTINIAEDDGGGAGG